MRRDIAISLLVICCGRLLPAPCSFAQDDGASHRKVVAKVTPQYPYLAHQLHLSGTVKLEAVVATDGKVRAIEVKGGHPMLAQAAVGAVEKWKWESAAHETKEPVNVKFDPQ